MKLKLALASTLLALATTTAQAAPSILSSVSPDSIQEITRSEAAKTRGAYYQCDMTINMQTGASSGERCKVHVRWQKHRPQSSQTPSADGKYLTIHRIVWAKKMFWRLHVAR